MLSLTGRGCLSSTVIVKSVVQYSTESLMKNLRLVTFDATGTLIKFRTPPVQKYVAFGAKYGIQVDPEVLTPAFKKHWKSLMEEVPHFGTRWSSWWVEFVIRTFQSVGVKADESTLHALADDLIAHFSSSEAYEPVQGAVSLLKSFHKTRIPIGIISNTDPRLRVVLSQLDMDKYLDFIILSQELQRSKPDKLIFDEAMREIIWKKPSSSRLDPSECLHIGDSVELDYIGAKNAGWNAILIGGDNEKVDKNEVFPSLIALHNNLARKGMVVSAR